VPFVRKGAKFRRGMGMYPDETCFDSTRPSWLPYWLDDIQEPQCKLNLLFSGNPTGNTAQAGTFVTDSSGAVVPAAAPATVQNAMSACASSGGAWDDTLQSCSPGILSQFSPYLIWGGVGLVGVLLLFGGRR